MQAALEAPVADGHAAAAPTPDLDDLAQPDAAPDPRDDTLELILTSDEHPLALARSLGVTLDHLLAFLDSDWAQHRLAQIERLETLRRQIADRRAEQAAKEALARLSTHVSQTPAEARDALLQQRAAAALLRHLKPASARFRKAGPRPAGSAGSAGADATPSDPASISDDPAVPEAIGPGEPEPVARPTSVPRPIAAPARASDPATPPAPPTGTTPPSP